MKLLEPSEKIMKKKPKVKIKILYLLKLFWFFDFIIKKLAVKPNIII